ncbi:MAG: AAA family ATPase [Chloroflexi bacterium]|nr:AAA family ATPase [Chloroflexota bacterium]
MHIPLGRITLLFGQNSAGKTAIMQALALLSDALESNAVSGQLDTTFDNTGVDLGGFEEFVHDHDIHRQVCIRVQVPVNSSEFDGFLGKDRIRDEPQIPVEKGAVEWRFAHAPETGGGKLAAIHLVLDDATHPQASFGMTTVETSAQPDIDELYRRQYADVRSRSVSLRRRKVPTALALCESANIDDRYRLENCGDASDVSREFRESHDREKLLQVAVRRVADRRGTDLGQVRINESDVEAELALLESSRDAVQDEAGEESKRAGAVSENSVPGVNTFPDCRDLDDDGVHADDFPIDALCSLIEREAGVRVAELDGIILADAGFLLHYVDGPVDSVSDLDTLINGCAGDVERNAFEEYCPFLTPANLTREIQLQVQASLESLAWIREVRSPPERTYKIGGSVPQGVGPSGKDLAGYLRHHPQVVEDTNRWLADLDIPYSVEIEVLEPSSRGVVSVRLRDVSRDPAVEVAFSDVGYGISQVLPLIVQSVGQPDGMVVIQQPEVHIHPRLQADLGDFFAKESETKQFLIETHSEHLMLRLLRKVREGELDPDDLSILYVDRGTDGSTVQRLNVGADGDFLDEWPGGFFPDRLRELR